MDFKWELLIICQIAIIIKWYENSWVNFIFKTLTIILANTIQNILWKESLAHVTHSRLKSSLQNSDYILNVCHIHSSPFPHRLLHPPANNDIEQLYKTCAIIQIKFNSIEQNPLYNFVFLLFSSMFFYLALYIYNLKNNKYIN